MKRLHKIITLAALVALPLFSVGLGQASAAPAPTPTFTITPNPAVGGDTVTFSGTGCLARTTDPKGAVPVVTITEVDEPVTHMQAHATPMADDSGLTTTPKPDGTWSISLPIPGFVSGEFEFGAVCDGYSWSISYDPVTLKVQYNPDSKPEIDVLDSTGAERTSLQTATQYYVLGEGFKPGEQVQLILHSSPVVLDTVVADDEFGGVITTFALPAGTTPGEHTLSLHGVSSGKTATLDIVVAGAVPITAITTVIATTPSSAASSSSAGTVSSSSITSTLSTSTLASTTTTSVVNLASTGTPAQSMVVVGGLLVLVGAGTLLTTRRFGRRPRQH